MDKELSLQEIHISTIPVIQEIEDICSMLGVNYVAFYGSLLGAIRHHGFIPWDDDFDIAMLRPDYEKFVNYCKTHESELGYFKVVDKKNTDDYPFNIARFCDLRYRMETSEFPDVGMGIFVDIYPLDPVGNDAEKARRRIQWRKKLYSIGWNSSIKKRVPETRKGTIGRIIKTFIYIWSKNKSIKYFFKKYDELADLYEYDKSSLVAVVVWDLSFYPMPRIWFEDLTSTPFENITVKVPKEYDRILKQVYGDYMKLPPKEKQHPTHSYKLYKK